MLVTLRCCGMWLLTWIFNPDVSQEIYTFTNNSRDKEKDGNRFLEVFVIVMSALKNML